MSHGTVLVTAGRRRHRRLGEGRRGRRARPRRSRERLADRSGESRTGDVRHGRADRSRTRSTLGFEPGVDLETGFARLVDGESRDGGGGDWVRWVPSSPSPSVKRPHISSRIHNHRPVEGRTAGRTGPPFWLCTRYHGGANRARHSTSGSHADGLPTHPLHRPTDLHRRARTPITDLPRAHCGSRDGIRHRAPLGRGHRRRDRLVSIRTGYRK